MGLHGKHRPLVIRAALLLAALLLPQQAEACRLALALALDVSSSVDARDYALQAEGLATALEDTDVVEAIFHPSGPVALAVYEWSGREQQVMVQDWVMIETPADLAALTATIRANPRSHNQFPTALGYALSFGALLLARAPACDARTLDVSGDGMANEGYAPVLAFRNFDFDGITVNGLVVGGSTKPELVAYYLSHVIHGEGAFVEVAEDYDDYGRAMRRKLLRELEPPILVGAVDEALE